MAIYLCLRVDDSKGKTTSLRKIGKNITYGRSPVNKIVKVLNLQKYNGSKSSFSKEPISEDPLIKKVMKFLERDDGRLT